MKERFWEAVGHPRNRRFNFFRIRVSAEERVSFEEMCLYTYEGGAHLGYGTGVKMNEDGDLFFGGNGRGNADGSLIIKHIEKARSK
jgi:hypothetical protein